MRAIPYKAKHPDKTFIGRIGNGFNFLGYFFGTDGLSVVKKTIEQFIACDPTLRAGGALRLSPAWIIRAAVARMDSGRMADDHPPQGPYQLGSVNLSTD